jgi:hypothetical protein
MPIIPGQDPNEAYDIGDLPAREHDIEQLPTRRPLHNFAAKAQGLGE